MAPASEQRFTSYRAKLWYRTLVLMARIPETTKDLCIHDRYGGTRLGTSLSEGEAGTGAEVELFVLLIAQKRKVKSTYKRQVIQKSRLDLLNTTHTLKMRSLCCQTGRLLEQIALTRRTLLMFQFLN